MTNLYRISPVRTRRTKAEMEELGTAIIEVLAQDHPQSVRHVWYCLCGTVVQKTDNGYRAVQAKLLALREEGVVPWGWVSDGTRWRQQGSSFGNIRKAIHHVADYYRRDLWRDTPVYVEVWTESDSMAGVLFTETDRYNVPLLVSRGFSSRTFLHHSAMAIRAQHRPAYIYYVGDWDPSGKLIPEVIERELKRFAPGCEIHFERLLVTPDQIRALSLPSKPAKATTHSRGFTGGTVEAEAVPAATTRRIVREAIERHLDLRQVEVLETAEESERHYLRILADQHTEEADDEEDADDD